VTANGIILAAGNGSRLREAIGPRSKCLADIGGEPLIVRQLDMMADAAIDDVTIVVGYDSSRVRGVVGGRATIVENHDFATTNSLASYLLAAPMLRGDVFVVNCDVLFPSTVLSEMELLGGNVVAIDSSSGSDPEHMNVAIAADGSVRAMSKALPPESVSGENLGILRFDVVTARAVTAAGSLLINRGRRTAWLAEAVEVAASRHRLAALDVAGTPWVEIDFPEDLDRARSVVWPALCGVGQLVDVGRESAHG
jgi:choline kinase